MRHSDPGITLRTPWGRGPVAPRAGKALCTALLICCACNASSDPWAEPEPDAPAAQPAAREREIVFELSPVLQLAARDTWTARLHNPSDQLASVSLSVTSISEAGTDKRERLRQLEIPGGATVVASFPASELRLPTGSFATSGQLWLTAETDFADGVHRTSTAAPLFFHPDANGWLVYDRAVRDERYARGALVDALRDLAPPEDAEQGGIQLVKNDDGPPLPERPSHDATTSTSPTLAQDAITLAGSQLERVTRLGDASAPTPRAKVNKRFCFKVVTDYDDVGIGEDQYPDAGPTARVARGMLWTSGSLSGNTGDGITGTNPEGCSQPISVTPGQSYSFRLYTSGTSNRHAIRVQDFTSGARASHLVAVTASASTTQWVTISPADARFNVYMVVAFSTFQHAGLGAGDVTVHASADDSHANGTDVWIQTGDEDEKFVIAHEVGHFTHRDSAGGVASDCSHQSTQCPSSGSHRITSKEFVSCAFSEGFADFFAADVFNNHGEDDCWLFMHGTTINCESANDALPLRYLEVTCDAPFAGFGVQTDWSRAFWDVHTNTTTEPTLNDMLRWMEDANDNTAWSKTNSYTLLDAEANAVGGVLGSNWDAAKTANGIDH